MKNKVKIKEEAKFPLSLFNGGDKYKNLPQSLGANTIVSLILNYEGGEKFVDLINKYFDHARKNNLIKNDIFIETWPTYEYNISEKEYFNKKAIPLPNYARQLIYKNKTK